MVGRPTLLRKARLGEALRLTDYSKASLDSRFKRWTSCNTVVTKPRTKVVVARLCRFYVIEVLAFLISIMGSSEMRWIESLIAAALMTAFCVLLFVYLLNLPFQLWPRFY